jgi:hypothetical protein
MRKDVTWQDFVPIADALRPIRECARHVLPVTNRQVASILRNVRWGVLNGLLYAAIGFVIVAVVALVRGQNRFGQYGLSMGTVFLTYTTGGIAAGAIVGLLRPWTKNAIGATIVGVVAGIPFMLAAFIGFGDSPRPLENVDWQGVLTIGSLLGGGFGYLRWKRMHGSSSAAE